MTDIGAPPPTGSVVHARLETGLSSVTAKVGDPVEAVITDRWSRQIILFCRYSGAYYRCPFRLRMLLCRATMTQPISRTRKIETSASVTQCGGNTGKREIADEPSWGEAVSFWF